MEVFGGIAIMLVIIGILFIAIWLSLPMLLFGLSRRLERLELRLSAFEHRLDRIQESLRSSHHDAHTQQNGSEGGLDGTA